MTVYPRRQPKKAMILAAGRGERMRPLTDHTPKPLLQVANKALIVWHIEKLAKVGVSEIVINTAWLSHALVAAIGDGSQWGVHVHWSHESAGGLETAGGVLKALPWLSDAPFYVINGDVWCDYDFAKLQHCALTQQPELLAHLVLVDNPEHNPHGDFRLTEQERLACRSAAETGLTFSGISVLSAELFAPWQHATGERLALRDVFAPALAQGLISAEYHPGQWTDVGTPERLELLNAQLLRRARKD